MTLTPVTLISIAVAVVIGAWLLQRLWRLLQLALAVAIVTSLPDLMNYLSGLLILIPNRDVPFCGSQMTGFVGHVSREEAALGFPPRNVEQVRLGMLVLWSPSSGGAPLQHLCDQASVRPRRYAS